MIIIILTILVAVIERHYIRMMVQRVNEDLTLGGLGLTNVL
mgnify:CR=1 FL=1